ncbi:Hypothetical predicted protein, partial [Mytilus galloprovincialis]
MENIVRKTETLMDENRKFTSNSDTCVYGDNRQSQSNILSHDSTVQADNSIANNCMCDINEEKVSEVDQIEKSELRRENEGANADSYSDFEVSGLVFNSVVAAAVTTPTTTTNDAARIHVQRPPSKSQTFPIQNTDFGTVLSTLTSLTYEKATKIEQSAQNKTQCNVNILKKSKTSASDFTPYSFDRNPTPYPLTRTLTPYPFTRTPTPEKKRKRVFTVPVLPTMGPSTKLLNLALGVRKRNSTLIQTSVPSICSVCTVYPHTISQNSASKISTASLSTETQSSTHSNAQNSTQSDTQHSTQSGAQNLTQFDAQNSTQYLLLPSKDQNTAQNICTVKSPSKTEKIERISTVQSHARMQKLSPKAKHQITAIKTKKYRKISTVKSRAKVQKSDPIICTVYPPTKYTSSAFRVSRNCYSTKPTMSWDKVSISTPVSVELVQDTASTKSESSESTRSESSVPTRSSESITSASSESTSSIKSESTASTRSESTESTRIESTESTRMESTESTRIESTASTSPPFPLALFPNVAAAQNKSDGQISIWRNKSFNTASNFARISTVQSRAKVQGPKGNHPIISTKTKKSGKISTMKSCAKVHKSNPVIYTVYPPSKYTRSAHKISKNSYITKPTMSWDKVPIITPVSEVLVQDTASTSFESSESARIESTASTSPPFPLALFPHVSAAQNKRDGHISNWRNESLNTASNFAPYPVLVSDNLSITGTTVNSTSGQKKIKSPSTKQQITGNLAAAEENRLDDIGVHPFASDDSKVKRLKRKIIEHDWKLNEILQTRNKRRKEALEKCFKKSGEELLDNSFSDSVHCTFSQVDAENVSVSAENQMQTVVSSRIQLKTVDSTQKQLKKVVSAHLISIGDCCVKALTNIIEKDSSKSHNTEVKVELMDKEYLQTETCRPEVVIENVEGTDYCQLYNDNKGQSIPHTKSCSFSEEHLLVQSKIKEESVPIEKNSMKFENIPYENKDSEPFNTCSRLFNSSETGSCPSDDDICPTVDIICPSDDDICQSDNDICQSVKDICYSDSIKYTDRALPVKKYPFCKGCQEKGNRSTVVPKESSEQRSSLVKKQLLQLNDVKVVNNKLILYGSETSPQLSDNKQKQSMQDIYVVKVKQKPSAGTEKDVKQNLEPTLNITVSTEKEETPMDTDEHGQQISEHLNINLSPDAETDDEELDTFDLVNRHGRLET